MILQASSAPIQASPEVHPRRHEVLESHGAQIGIVPLQPAPTRPASQETGTSGTSEQTTPDQRFTFDPTDMETMGLFVKEALKQMGVTDIKVTKTRKNTRSAKGREVKAQQARMSKEADIAWKVR